MERAGKGTREIWMERARAFYADGNWIGAVSSARNALRLDARNIAGWHILCAALVGQDRQYDAMRYAGTMKRFAAAAGDKDEEAFADKIIADAEHYFATQHLRFGETDLTHFAALGDVPALRRLLEGGADPDERNRTGWTALHCVAQRGSEAAARLLVAFGADLEAENSLRETPLITACCFGNIEIVPVLLELGANVRHVAKEKHTALWYAISSQKNLPLVEQLIGAGADPNEDYEYGDNPFLLAVCAQRADVVSFLLKLTRDPGRMNKHQVSALHFAASYNDAPLIQELLARGVDVNMTTPDGFSALMRAAEEGSLRAVDILLKHGARTDLKSRYGDTAKSLAEHRGHAEAVRMLNGVQAEKNPRNGRH